MLRAVTRFGTAYGGDFKECGHFRLSLAEIGGNAVIDEGVLRAEFLRQMPDQAFCMLCFFLVWNRESFPPNS